MRGLDKSVPRYIYRVNRKYRAVKTSHNPAPLAMLVHMYVESIQLTDKVTGYSAHPELTSELFSVDLLLLYNVLEKSTA